MLRIARKKLTILTVEKNKIMNLANDKCMNCYLASIPVNEIWIDRLNLITAPNAWSQERSYWHLSLASSTLLIVREVIAIKTQQDINSNSKYIYSTVLFALPILP